MLVVSDRLEMIWSSFKGESGVVVIWPATHSRDVASRKLRLCFGNLAMLLRAATGEGEKGVAMESVCVVSSFWG